MTIVTRRGLAALGAGGLLPATGALAADYPARPITYVSPYPPGGTNDLAARIVARDLTARFGQPVLVENKGGAGGTIGSDFVAKAAPDGYTLLNTAGTDAEARRKFKEVQDLVIGEYAPIQVGALLGLDLSRVSRDERIVDVFPEEAFAQHRWLGTALAAFGDDSVTLFDLFHYVSNRGHLNQPPVVGSGRRVARWIAENFEARAFDGVKLFPAYARAPLDAFVDLVVPELQRFGILRRSYETSTLRGHLGLRVPPSPHAARAPEAVA